MRKIRQTKEFKDSAVQLALNSDESVRKIAQDLDINSKTLYNWIGEYKRADNIQIDSRRSSQKSISKESLDEENQRLRRENKLLRQERDILKKATAYFAKETL